MKNNRDDFSLTVKDILAKRVGYVCSNPNCKKHTIAPNSKEDKVINIGEAAHITAAAPGGPRYDEALSPSERKSINNGIWLCSNCATLIDRDELIVSVWTENNNILPESSFFCSNNLIFILFRNLR